MAQGNPHPLRSPETEFTEGNQAALKHGGRGAMVRIRDGKPFIGYAREVYLQVIDELGIDLDRLSGVDRVRVQRAAQMEACARMFDNAALGAAEAGEVTRWERYNQRAGWIGSKGFSALGEIREMLKDEGDIIDAAVLAAKDATDGKD